MVYDCKREGAYLHHPVDVDENEYPRLTNEGILFHHIKLQDNVIIYIYIILSFNVMIVVTRYHSRIMIVESHSDTIIVDMYEPSNRDEVDVEFNYYINLNLTILRLIVIKTMKYKVNGKTKVYRINDKHAFILYKGELVIGKIVGLYCVIINPIGFVDSCEIKKAILSTPCYEEWYIIEDECDSLECLLKTERDIEAYLDIERWQIIFSIPVPKSDKMISLFLDIDD